MLRRGEDLPTCHGVGRTSPHASSGSCVGRTSPHDTAWGGPPHMMWCGEDLPTCHCVGRTSPHVMAWGGPPHMLVQARGLDCILLDFAKLD